HADTLVYVSLNAERKIQLYRLDPADGKLTAGDAIAVEGAPGCLALDPKQKFLFATLRSNDTLASFRIDPTSGKLTHFNTVALGKGDNAAYLATDRTGRWLFSASYAAGKVMVHDIHDDGTLGSPPVQVIETTKTSHSTVPDPGNRWVFVPHVAPNEVYQ